MKRVCIIGGTASIWIKEYVKNIHYCQKNEVCIVVLEKLPKQFAQEYSALGVNVIDVTGNKSYFTKIKKTVKLLSFCFRYKKSFDLLEIHCPPHSFQAYIFAMIVKFFSSKTITTFWGSDILRINKRDAKRLQRVICNSDLINIGTNEMLKAFHGFFGKKYDQKIVSAKFGSLAFDELRKSKSWLSPQKAKKDLNLTPNKLTVAVGYNGKKRQQHIETIEALSKLKDAYKNKVELVLHVLDYEDEEYLINIINKLQQSGIKYIVIKDMLSLKEISSLRWAVDIFIHAQTTDALSSTIREYLFTETIILNPEWIKYDEYTQLGIEYIEYKSFQEIPSYLVEIIENRIIINTKKNAQLVFDEYSWDAVRSDWIRIL